MGENRYLLTFPVLGFIFALIPLVVFWVPAAIALAAGTAALAIVLAVLGVIVTPLALTFTAGALVAATDAQLAGRPSGVGYGLGTALGRFFPLMGWAIVALFVNGVASLVRGDSSGAAGVVRNIAAAGILVVWRIVNFFTLPYIMLDSAGPIHAINLSRKLVQKRWGLQVFGGVRIGGRIALFTFLPALLLIVLGVYLMSSNVDAAGIAIAVVGVIIFIIGSLLLSMMRGVFSVVLFRYAHDDQALGGFASNDLAAAIQPRK